MLIIANYWQHRIIYVCLCALIDSELFRIRQIYDIDWIEINILRNCFENGETMYEDRMTRFNNTLLEFSDFLNIWFLRRCKEASLFNKLYTNFDFIAYAIKSKTRHHLDDDFKSSIDQIYHTIIEIVLHMKHKS